jgi:glycosyltransferase involved in cell wall biosynthesis
LKFGDPVSVLVPVYNRAHLIERTLGSVCTQSYRNLEIILVDDCSTDDLDAAVARIGDTRIHLVRRDRNGGVAAARNAGVAAATAELIAFFDSDDICVFDRIERQVRQLLTMPSDYVGVYSPRLFYSLVDEGTYPSIACAIRPFPLESPLSGDLSARTIQNNIINFPSLMVRKSALLAAGPSDELLRNNADWDLCLRLTRQGKFAFDPEPLILTPNPLKTEGSGPRISQSTRHQAQSFARVTGKMRHQGITGIAIAAHYCTTARKLVLRKRLNAARRFFRASLSEAPLKPKVWVHLLLSYTPTLARQLAKLRAQRPSL